MTCLGCTWGWRPARHFACITACTLFPPAALHFPFPNSDDSGDYHHLPPPPLLPAASSTNHTYTAATCLLTIHFPTCTACLHTCHHLPVETVGCCTTGDLPTCCCLPAAFVAICYCIFSAHLLLLGLGVENSQGCSHCTFLCLPFHRTVGTWEGRLC